jgi:TonB-dependent starch-binding outer membrane protein SusC
MTRSVRTRAAALALGVGALAAAPPALLAQGASATIEGRVTDANTNRPVVGAQVYIGTRGTGTITNAQGEYRIPPVPMANQARMTVEVKVRMLGYNQASKTIELQVAQTARADFALSASALQLNQVVVTGTGQEVETRKLGNTVAVLEKPEFAPIKSTSELLQGREPGVSGLPSGGMTGEGSRIRIRGNASLSQSNEPIVFLDGIRIDNNGGMSQGGVSTSRLDDLDPSAIERVEILKGAAAATLYGTEASNGVIQIFTKRGSSGAPKWEFEADQAFIKFPGDRVKPASGFVGCRSYTYTGSPAAPTAATCTNAATVSAQLDTVNKFYGTTYAPYQVISKTPWQDMMATGLANTFSGSVTGGTPAVTYFVSGRMYRENGPIDAASEYNEPLPLKFQDDTYRQAQGTANISIIPHPKLRFGVRSAYTDASVSSIQINNNIYAPGTLAMFSKPEVAHCNRSAIVAGQARCTGVPNGTTGADNQAGNSAFASVREALLQETGNKVRRYIGSIEGAYTPVSSVNINSTLGVDVTTQRARLFRPFGWNVDNFTGNQIFGSSNVSDRLNRVITMDTKASWNKVINNDLTSDLVVGLQGFVTHINYTSGFATEFPGPGIEVASAGAKDITVGETYINTVNGGLFAQDQLGWKNFAFVTFGGRYDYASAFGKNTPGVFYPKVSVSIVPSDLGWWRSSTVSTLRFRSALGRSGKQPGAFDRFTTFEALGGELGAGLAPNNLGNQDLKPEVSTEFEVGAEVGLMNNKYGVDVTLWNRVVDDALVARVFPPSGGFRNSQLDNIGQLKAQGAEISLKSLVISRPNLSVDLFANGAYLWQKIVSMGGSAPIKVGGSYVRYRNFLREGYAPGALFGVELPSACPSGTSRPATNPINNITCLNPGETPYNALTLGIATSARPATENELRAWLGQPRNALTALLPALIRKPGLCPLPSQTPVQSTAEMGAGKCLYGDPLLNYQGKPTPNWSGGFGGTITVNRNWRVGTLFEYKAGDYTITNLTDAFRNSSPANGGNSPDRARVEAALANPASTVDQRYAAAMEWANELAALTPYDGLNQNQPGDFLRWRELSLTYQMSPNMASRIGARSMSISLTGRNIMLWTKYPGMDPEVNAIGRPNDDGNSSTDNIYLDSVDAFGYPIPRRFSISVRLGY